MFQFKKDLPPEVLQKSLENRDYLIDWSSLKLFQYKDKDKSTALIGKSICRKLSVRISSVDDKGSKSDRPFCLFYKQKNNKIRIEEAYYLSDDECLKFESMFYVKH